MGDPRLPEESGPYRGIIYDKDFELIGFIVDPLFLNVVPAWDDQDYGNFRVTGDNPHTAALQEPGARVTIEYRGKVYLSGPITSWQGDILSGGNITYQVLGDRQMPDDAVMWPNPGNPLMPASRTELGQAWKRPEGDLRPGEVVYQDGYYQWPASVTTYEAAIKWVIQDQLVTRLGQPLTVLPDKGRGGVLDREDLPRIRLDPVWEALTPLKNASGLGVRFWQDPLGKTVLFDVVEPSIWPEELTVESGIIVGGTYQARRPIATRIIVGGNGETAARAFYGEERRGRQTALEKQWGMIAEIFRDATSGELVWPEGLDEKYKVPKYAPFVMTATNWASYKKTLIKSERDGLALGAANTSLDVELAETETFHFGGSDGIPLGATVTIIIRGVVYHDVVTSANIVFNRDNGLVVTPYIGTYEDDPDTQLAKTVRALSDSQRRQNTRR
jgi:hypothetical protein